MSINEQELKEAVQATLEDKFPDIKSLTDVQLIDRKDEFCILPTGYGKSLIFQIAPSVAQRLGKTHNFPEKPILIVICPLNSLIDSHVRELRKRGFSVTSLSNEEDEQAILDGEFTFVFCNTESIIRRAKWREMVSSEIYQANLLAFVTDEVHVVPICRSYNYNNLL
jgi:ATP-dependent DNA helicase RecQ